MILFLRLFAIGCFLPGLLHILFGLGADNMLGAGLDEETLANPALDSQNRFYGAAFMLYGGVAWLAAGDVDRFAPTLKLVALSFLLGGVVRFIPFLQLGWPGWPIVTLQVSELLIPPVILLWLAKRTKV